jgi:tRNA-dihydrouridine synthase A
LTTLSVAPMLDWTDRHARFFLRLLSQQTVLYTEMLTARAVFHGDQAALLAFDPAEEPLVLQLGGAEPDIMAKAAEAAAARGYRELNINVGCPSDRVQAGRFGACLMAEPATVAACIIAMRAASGLPVTVKTRLGIDDLESWEFLTQFVATVADAGCPHVILHARKAWLSGLSPRENREIPPLQYEKVYQVKAAFPQLTITLNGGVRTVADVSTHLAACDGVMIGRAISENPWFLAELAAELFDERLCPSREAAVRAYRPYVARQLVAGVPLRVLVRPLMGLYQGQPGARAWRRTLTLLHAASDASILDAALSCVNAAA